MDKIASFFTSRQRNKIKRYLRKIKSSVLFWVQPMTIDKMEKVLRYDFNIKEGDAIFVASAFGSLNATFSPKDLIELLIKIIGEEGVIMMPYYPPGSASEWAASGEIFDMEHTASSMGVLTNVFSKMPNVFKSNHPTKAVCVWGKNAKQIAHGHAFCKSPFGEDSPYGKLFKLHSKSIGIGTMKYTMGHCFEDLLNPNLSQYYPPVSLGVREDGHITYYPTLVHNTKKLKIAPSKFIKRSLYIIKVKTGYDYSYTIDNDKGFEFYKNEFINGRRSLS